MFVCIYWYMHVSLVNPKRPGMSSSKGLEVGHFLWVPNLRQAPTGLCTGQRPALTGLSPVLALSDEGIELFLGGNS